MHANDICLLLVTCLAASISQSQAIRVDWGTNKGPIVPPTPTTTVPPRLPYREPAPVWEDHSDDIPNPNPYVYVLPPPSRPRTWAIMNGPYANSPYPQPIRNYGMLLRPEQGYNNGAGFAVAGLSPQYVPGVGFKYTAVVPRPQSDGNFNSYIADKLQGKYNAKTKKYKAYEKAKYAPLNYQQLVDAVKQQLPPLKAAPLDWHRQPPQPALTGSATAMTTTAASKLSSMATATPTTTTTDTATATTTTTIKPAIASTTTTTTTTNAATSAAAGKAMAIKQQQAVKLSSNYKLAHEKSAFMKYFQPSQKKKLQLQLQLKEQAQAQAPNLLHVAKTR